MAGNFTRGGMRCTLKGKRGGDRMTDEEVQRMLDGNETTAVAVSPKRCPNCAFATERLAVAGELIMCRAHQAWHEEDLRRRGWTVGGGV